MVMCIQLKCHKRLLALLLVAFACTYYVVIGIAAMLLMAVTPISSSTHDDDFSQMRTKSLASNECEGSYSKILSRREFLGMSHTRLHRLEETLLNDYVRNNSFTRFDRHLKGAVESDEFNPENPDLLDYLTEQLTSVFNRTSWRYNSCHPKLEQQSITLFVSKAVPYSLDHTSEHDHHDSAMAKIFMKYFDNDFSGKTFIQVGSRNRESCWEHQIQKKTMAPPWNGLVVEMDYKAIEPEHFYTKVAAFCVSPKKHPTYQLMKRFLIHREKPLKTNRGRQLLFSTLKINATNSLEPTQTLLASKMDSIAHESTIRALGDLHDLSGRTSWKQFTHLQMVPVRCFPLWSIMAAANVTNCEFLTIASAGYAGMIAETLPWDKISPKVVHLTDLGYAESTRKLLESAGYEMDTELSTLEQRIFPGSFVFFRTRLPD